MRVTLTRARVARRGGAFRYVCLKALLVAAACLPCTGVAGGIKEPLTVAAAIETTRILPTLTRFNSEGKNWSVNQVHVSPDGRRYAVMLVRGDVKSDRIQMELIAGALDSIETAASYRRIGPLSTSGFGPSPITYRFDYQLKWLPDSRRIAFLAEAADGTIQVAVADATSGEISFVTDAPADVGFFDISHGDDMIFTTAVKPARSVAEGLISAGFAVTELDARDLLNGSPNGSGRELYRHMATNLRPDAGTREIELQGDSVSRIPPQLIAFSPDGLYAIVDATPPPTTIPDSWSRYSHPYMAQYAKEAREPGGGRAWIIQRLYLLDVKYARARPLLDAPKAFIVNHVAWSPDSRFVALGPTFLPPDSASQAGLAGNAIAIVDIATGRHSELAPPADLGAGFHVGSWGHDGTLQLQNANTILRYRRKAERWRLIESREREAAGSKPGAIRVVVKEDLHTPPALFAIDSTGRERVILDLNPGLVDRYSLGAVEMVEWPDPQGRTWRGRVYYPVGFEKGRRFPLVVQTHGVAPADQFSLYGIGGSGYVPGLGPPGVSINAAQILANRGMAVLQVEDKMAGEREDFTMSPREPQVYQAAFEAGIDMLVDKGIVDPLKVGISGFSRTGWYVEYALSHSQFPYAAAVVSDNLTGGYLQACLIGAAGGLVGEFAQNNGAPGIGEGLNAWLQHAPAFNAHRIKTPLRMQVESGGLANVVLHWEMFNALSLLGKPAELYVVPSIDRGAHNLQNPRQVLSAAEATVDWFDFWLNGREDASDAKAAQYARWRKLRNSSKE